MSKLWRRAAVFSMSAGLLLAGGFSVTAASAAQNPTGTPSPAASPTQPAPTASPTQAPAQPRLTISASSALKPVSGYVLVVFQGGKYAKATIRGQVSGAASGDVVQLYAQRFPYKRMPGLLASVKLTKSAQSYSFRVRPTIATHYQVKLSGSGTSSSGTSSSGTAAPLASSRVQTVYITSGGRLGVKRGCGSGTVCRPEYRFYLYLPSSVVRSYISRHWYVYVGVRRSAKHVPGQPTWLNLDKHATVSRPRRVTGRQYERTVGFTFWVGRDAASWDVLACAKDAESTDGVGLPGRHACGRLHIRRTVAYLG